MTQQSPLPDELPEPEIAAAWIAAAEKLMGLRFSPGEREQMREGLQNRRDNYESLRALPLDNAVPPALRFDPRPPGFQFAEPPTPTAASSAASTLPRRPDDLEELAFWSIPALGAVLRSGAVTSVELTEMYLTRLRRYDDVLHAVVTLTPELARTQAARADEELARGVDRGPLHGIPYGAKDLLAVPDFPTTWGAAPFREQTRPETAAVVERLEEAGAVLVAKLSLGALANGDVWFGGQTLNPWNLKEGSSGSSAGSAAAVAAGLVGFAIGSETLGSIVAPCSRCGVTGLRPTFGRISRYGVMALSWSMDKVGPIARSAEGCALVLDAIQGRDPRDPTTIEAPYVWPTHADVDGLRIGYEQTMDDEPYLDDDEAAHATRARDRQVLDVLRDQGATLIPIDLPDVSNRALTFILSVEAAAAFDELTRKDMDELLTRQDDKAWPNTFRSARFAPAVEYIQANRVRTLLIHAMAEIFRQVDCYVAPSFGTNLYLTNLTGHPAVVLPNGLNDEGTPANQSITITGRLFDESTLLTVAHAYQERTSFHLLHPPLTTPKHQE